MKIFNRGLEDCVNVITSYNNYIIIILNMNLHVNLLLMEIINILFLILYITLLTRHTWYYQLQIFAIMQTD